LNYSSDVTRFQTILTREEYQEQNNSIVKKTRTEKINVRSVIVVTSFFY